MGAGFCGRFCSDWTRGVQAWGGGGTVLEAGLGAPGWAATVRRAHLFSLLPFGLCPVYVSPLQK